MFKKLSVSLASLLFSYTVLANTNSIIGTGTSNAYSSTNSGCDDTEAVVPALAQAKINADSDAINQCNDKAAHRATDYQVSDGTKLRGAVCVIRAQAVYTCE